MKPTSSESRLCLWQEQRRVEVTRRPQTFKQNCRQIPFTAVWQHRDNGLARCLGTGCHFQGNRHGRTATDATGDSLFLHQSAGDLNRFRIGDSLNLVNQRSIQNVGDETAPIPWILCGPGVPPDRTGLAAGSTAMIRVESFFSCLRYRETPVIVPPVPTPETK